MQPVQADGDHARVALLDARYYLLHRLAARQREWNMHAEGRNAPRFQIRGQRQHPQTELLIVEAGARVFQTDWRLDQTNGTHRPPNRHVRKQPDVSSEATGGYR